MPQRRCSGEARSVHVDLHPFFARRDGKRRGEAFDRVGREAVDGVVVVLGVFADDSMSPIASPGATWVPFGS